MESPIVGAGILCLPAIAAAFVFFYHFSMGIVDVFVLISMLTVVPMIGTWWLSSGDAKAAWTIKPAYSVAFYASCCALGWLFMKTLPHLTTMGRGGTRELDGQLPQWAAYMMFAIPVVCIISLALDRIGGIYKRQPVQQPNPAAPLSPPLDDKSEGFAFDPKRFNRE